MDFFFLGARLHAVGFSDCCIRQQMFPITDTVRKEHGLGLGSKIRLCTINIYSML